MTDQEPKVPDATEQIFKDEIALLARADKALNDPNPELRKIYVEFKVLRDGFEKLLETSMRIAKAGDRAQKKLLKYKELMDTLRDTE